MFRTITPLLLTGVCLAAATWTCEEGIQNNLACTSSVATFWRAEFDDSKKTTSCTTEECTGDDFVFTKGAANVCCKEAGPASCASETTRVCPSQTIPDKDASCAKSVCNALDFANSGKSDSDGKPIIPCCTACVFPLRDNADKTACDLSWCESPKVMDQANKNCIDSPKCTEQVLNPAKNLCINLQCEAPQVLDASKVNCIDATKAPTKAPTAPTKAPTKSPTKAPTAATVADVKKTDDKPSFSQAAYDAKKAGFTVASAWTPSAAVAKKVPVAPAGSEVVSFGLGFPITKEQAGDAKMQESLSGGLAKSLGLDVGKVSVTHIDGDAVARRLLADLEITFQIISNEDDTTKLQSNIKEAAKEGSIVAFIQEEASTNGVLTEELLKMPIVLDAPTIVAKKADNTETFSSALSSAPGLFAAILTIAAAIGI